MGIIGRINTIFFITYDYSPAYGALHLPAVY